TNDLDITTLEIIEESLNEFAGAVVLITHDRCLMDRVCTQILGLGENNEHELFADYNQWEQSKSQRTSAAKKEVAAKPPQKEKPISSKKLSYKEQKELESMEATIVAVEAEIAALEKKLEGAEMVSDAGKALDCYRSLAEAQKKQEALFERWQYLESLLL
ncbi:MAG TPA: hypothetical protein VN457_01720, partial [Chlamydiales bacterium]|nr:hypothetical protein [Chlamydiales bacterium]